MFISPKDIIKNLNLTLGEVVADFGCGQGDYVFEISKIVGDEGKVYALDTHKDILEKINREAEKLNITNIDTLLGDVEEKVLLNDHTCDLVIMSNLLSEITNLEKAIKEAKRILKAKGRILIIDWKNEDNPLAKKRFNLLSEEKIIAILAKQNLAIKKHLGAGDYHYALLVS